MLKNWNLIRVLRLVIGTVVLYEATHDDSIILYIIGSFITLHAFVNPSCGSSACAKGKCEISESEEAVK